jgi:fibronectin type 3 domain-containing protein
MTTRLAYRSRLSVPQWCPHLLPTLLLAVIISACGDGGSIPVTSNQVSFGSATLSWTPPTQNTDGSPLTDLASYKIYYGNESGNYHTSIQINNNGMTVYVVKHLTSNTYYFVMTAINSSGVESNFSNEAIKQVL